MFLYDRRGSGRSAGDFTTASFADLAGDAAASVGALRMRADIDESRLGLYGISQGGWIAPLVAAQDPGISFLVIVSGCGVSPAAQMDYAAGYALRAAGYPAEVIGTALAMRQRVNDFYRGELPAETVKAEIADVEGEPWYEHTYIGESEGLPEDVTRDKWYYELDHDPLPAWGQVRQPALFLFGEHDPWVPVAQSLARFQEATAHLDDVTFAEIPGADHFMSELGGRMEGEISKDYIDVLVDWLAPRACR